LCAFFEPNAARALHLQEKQIDQVFHPGDFPAAQRRGVAVDHCARMVGHHFIAVDAHARRSRL
jgi:hypothetical protein